MQHPPQSTTASPELLDLLRHMLGVTTRMRKSQYGYRNYFCAEIGGKDHASMLRLVELGWVKPGRKINAGSDQYFHATVAGCEAIGLSPATILRVFQD